ncbi:hypothetical protein HY639_04905 [Candidatus Woesearchaeota archaeon]|nr:hypothetical protein [Candidatus Woesearchaeota archaeon]
MEKTLHYAHPTGFAAGLTAGLMYMLCAAAVTVWPDQMLTYFSEWFHIVNFKAIFVPPQITMLSFFRGLVTIMLFAYVTGFFFALLYNICVAHCKKKGWI